MKYKKKNKQNTLNYSISKRERESLKKQNKKNSKETFL